MAAPQPFRPVSNCLSVTPLEYRPDFCQAVAAGAAHRRCETLTKSNYNRTGRCSEGWVAAKVGSHD